MILRPRAGIAGLAIAALITVGAVVGVAPPASAAMTEAAAAPAPSAVATPPAPAASAPAPAASAPAPAVTAPAPDAEAPAPAAEAPAVNARGLAAAEPLLPGPAPIEQRNAKTATTDVLPTVQIDSGIVWAQVINGDTVYAGGSFSAARPADAAPGQNLMPRSNLLAYDINTGVATDFAPQINGTIRSLAVSPDGKRLYVGGSFTKVGDKTRYNVAAFNTATGALLESFRPAVGGAYVNAIVATGNTVYFGGLIGAGAGVTRKNLVAFDTGGALLGWAPTTDLQVDSMVVNPSGTKIIAAGRFETVNGATSRGLAALDPVSGALVPWEIVNTVRNGRATGSGAGKAGISQITTDQTGAVYGTGWVYADTSVGNLEGLFAADGDTGRTRWIADCHGDHYGIYSDGTNVYSTSHEHDCQTAGGLPQGDGAPGNMRNATVYTAAAKGTLSRSPYVNSIYADWSGYPAPAAVNWFPDWATGTASGMGQAGWTVTGNDKYVLFGGEALFVNSKRAQGIARFAMAPPGGPKDGPRLAGVDWAPTAAAVGDAARVSFPANWDRDDLNLTYELWENGATEPASTLGVTPSTFWNRPQQTMWARGLAPGSTHTYTVVAKDTSGNEARSGEVTVTIGAVTPSAYADMIVADGANMYWRLGAPNEVGGADVAGNNDAVWAANASTSLDGAIVGDANGSGQYAGTATSMGRSLRAVSPGDTFALETWVKTTTTTGGKIIGRGSSTSGSSTSYDRQIYMTNSGALVFGVYSGSPQIIQSPKRYNDGEWHHVVAQLGSAGMELYVDGTRVASDASVTRAEATSGYWRLAGDTLGGWPNEPSSRYFAGKLDEVAVYGKALTAGTIGHHHSMGAGYNVPVGRFTVAGSDLNQTFDATSSTAAAGRTITNYAWAFGDGATASGPTAQHTYAIAGDYQVTLTVTDSDGYTAKTTKKITVTQPHRPPVAVVAVAVEGLTATFSGEGTTSTPPSTISRWAWDFGDGSTSSDVAPTHRYAAPGTYTATVVVTDSAGVASLPVTSTVTVTHDDPVAEFTTDKNGLAVSVDASGSSASDGATLQYAWNWGDETPSTSGKTASHTYAQAGTYDITLMVTDSVGSMQALTHTVEVVKRDVIARDDFERTVASGWGTAPVGGAWSTGTGLSVSGGTGKMSVGKSQTRASYLSALAVGDQDVTATISADRVADGGGLHTNLVSHRSAAGEYRLKVRTTATGSVIASLNKLVGTTESTLVSQTIPRVTYTAGMRLSVHLRTQTVAGVTTLSANVWPKEATEPTGWLLTATDETPALQAPGQVGFAAYATGSVTNGPVVVSLDDLVVVGPVETVHTAPTAVIGATTTGSSVEFTANGSTAADGATVTGFEWNFGDGETSTEAAPSHTYAAPGTYEVSLTVTDSAGAVSSVAKTSVVIVATAPTAVFTSAVDQLSVTVDASASTGANPLTYSWNWGDESPDDSGAIATHAYAATGTYTVTLTVTDSSGVTATAAAPVSVTAPAVDLATDDFERSVPSGWGDAPLGGTWATGSGFSVGDGVGRISLGKGSTRTATLSGVNAANTDVTVALGADKVADGGGLHLNVVSHKTGAGEYRAKARIAANGSVQVSLAKVVGTAEALVANKVLPGYTYTPGAVVIVRFQTAVVEGATQLQAKVWPAGQDEPAEWTLTGSDATAELQAPGAVGVMAYLSSTSTQAPVTVIVDNLTVR